MSIIFSRTDLFNYIINTGFRPINIIRNLSLEHGFVTGLQYLHMNNLLPKKIWGSQYGETGKFLLSHNYLYTGGIYLRS